MVIYMARGLGKIFVFLNSHAALLVDPSDGNHFTLSQAPRDLPYSPSVRSLLFHLLIYPLPFSHLRLLRNYLFVALLSTWGLCNLSLALYQAAMALMLDLFLSFCHFCIWCPNAQIRGITTLFYCRVIRPIHQLHNVHRAKALQNLVLSTC